MNILLRILVTSLAAFIAAWITPGVHIDRYTTALVFALVFGLLNFFIKPILVILTLPITIITMGLFLLVINAIIILIAAHYIHGLHVAGFWSAFLFSILLSIFTSVLHKLGQKKMG